MFGHFVSFFQVTPEKKKEMVPEGMEGGWINVQENLTIGDFQYEYTY